MGIAIVVVLGICLIILTIGFVVDICENDGDGFKNLFGKREP